MNGGIISQRYGKAFFDFTESEGSSDKVSEQVRTLLSLFAHTPSFANVFYDPVRTSLDVKVNLLKAAVNPEPLRSEIEKLLRLMDSNSRVGCFRMALLEFLQQYRESRNMAMVQITYAKKEKDLVPMVGEAFKKDVGKTPIFNEKEDPSLIGGFLIESWGWRFDATVKGALERAKEQLIQKTKRLV